jgi:hypothetical protein
MTRREVRIEYHGRLNCYIVGELVGSRVVWCDLNGTVLEMVKAAVYERYGNNISISHN